MLPPLPAQAATYTWTGGGGSWSTSSTSWNSPIVATPWDSTNGTASIADFINGGDAPVVSGGIYVNGIRFDNTANISGGTINLVSGILATPTITVNTSGGTIGSWLAGSAGLNVNGTGTLFLTNGSNNFTGGVNLNSGVLDFSNNAASTPPRTASRSTAARCNGPPAIPRIFPPSW